MKERVGVGVPTGGVTTGGSRTRRGAPRDGPGAGARGEGRPPLFEAGDPVAVLGLGASGTAAARLAAAHGAKVYASDAYGGEAQEAAAESLRAEGVDAEAGRHDIPRILESRVVVVSPGIDPSAEVRRAVREGGVPAFSEVELAYRHLESRIVGITGTNGKTTTTALCGHLLETGGLDAVTAGNIGRPLSEIAAREDQPAWVVVELSSFQLADLDRFSPEIGVLLNLAPDHLDRYASVDRYYSDKAHLFDNASEESHWVLNADDPGVLEMAGGAAGSHHEVSLEDRDGVAATVDGEGRLVCRLGGREEPWLPVDELRLVGRHNVMNALLAGTAAALAGCAAEEIGRGLATFEGLPHRLQPVGERDGVLWVNDSKATNISATVVALRSFEPPVVLVLGGRHKGEPYAPLVAELEGVRGLIAFGEAAPQIVAEVGDAVEEVQVATRMEDVARRADRLAEPGDVVLFSPACSSFDMFPSYKARGEAFVAAFRALGGGG